jgi:NADH-quinone oxidoreductase subunit F
MVSGFECLGACDLAPMASIDERYFGPLDEADAATAVSQIRAGEDPLPDKALARPSAAVKSETPPPPDAGASEPGDRSFEGERAGAEEAAGNGETRLLFRHVDEAGLAGIDTYRRLGGYRAIEKAYRDMGPEDVLSELEGSGLRGRGGAGFDMGKKASFLPRGDMDKYLCCNADESEPGAFKDRELMQKNPHQLIEGIVIAALAAGANRAFIFIRGEYDLQGDILDAAVAEAYGAGYLGDDVLGTGRQVELVVHRGAGAYICGEETALLDALEGKRGNPRLKPPFPAVQGLYGGPTLINNVETLSNVPHIVMHGADWFRSFGTERSPGTKVVSVSGCVSRPGNYEVDLGIPAREIVYDLAGGPLDGSEVKAWYPGGSSAPVLTAAELDLPYSFEAMADAGSMLGSGSIIVADHSVSIPEMALRTARFYHHESCGKCTPCREGTNWTVKMLERVLAGDATPMDLDIIASVQENIIGNCLCVLGDSMAMPVGAMVSKFRGEFEAAIEAGQAAAQASFEPAAEPAAAQMGAR